MGSWAGAGWYPPGDSTYVYVPHFALKVASQTDIPRVWVPQGKPKEKALL